MLNTIPVLEHESWQESLVNAVKDLPALLNHLGLDASALNLSTEALTEFPLRVPLPYLARIEKGNPRDPLLLQVLPRSQENDTVPGFDDDPLQESHFNPHPGLLQKYHGRALLVSTSSCAIHCRYCFRRHFPYESNNPGRLAWQQSLDYLAADTSIHEIILSGGDPLALSDRHLSWLIHAIEAIPQVTRLRIHTRLPIMIPQRVNRELCWLLETTRLQTVLVLHSNHAREFDSEVDAACRRLDQAGSMLLNQSVLLKDINDDPDTLCELSERLFSAGVLPYYLHLLDRTRGTAHFETDEANAGRLMAQMRSRLPGYLVPRLVREEAGASSKTPVQGVPGSENRGCEPGRE